MHAKAHTPRFLTTHQHLAAEHFAGDVFETNRLFDHLTAKVFSHTPHQIRTAHGLDHLAGQIPGPGQMINEQRHQQLSTAVTPLLVDGGNAISIAIKNNAHCRLTSGCAGFHLGNQLAEVRSKRLRWMAAKEGVPLRADFAHRLPEQRRQTTSGRAMHRIHDHLETQALQPMAQRIGVHRTAQAMEVLSPAVKAFGFPGFGHGDAAGL